MSQLPSPLVLIAMFTQGCEPQSQSAGRYVYIRCVISVIAHACINTQKCYLNIRWNWRFGVIVLEHNFVQMFLILLYHDITNFKWESRGRMNLLIIWNDVKKYVYWLNVWIEFRLIHLCWTNEKIKKML